MPATVSKPIPRLFSLIRIFLLARPVYVDAIVNASPSCIFFSIWPPVAVNIHYFLVHAIDGLGRGHRRNTLKQGLDVFKHYCERSELLFWQLHQFELGCIKLHTPYRYKVHPNLSSDWSMPTVFYKHRVEFLNTLQHRVESLWYSVVLSTSWLAGHVMLELKSVKVIHLLMTARQALRQLLGSWSLNTGTSPTESRLARKREKYAQRTGKERLHDAHQKRMTGVSWRQHLGGASPATGGYGLLHRDLKTRFCS